MLVWFCIDLACSFQGAAQRLLPDAVQSPAQRIRRGACAHVSRVRVVCTELMFVLHHNMFIHVCVYVSMCVGL